MTLEPRDRWVRAAEGWEARADDFARDTLPVTARMVDAIAPQPGQTILELAAGLGDTGYLAYELIQPGGELITSDFAPEMLSAAQRRAPSNANIRFRQMDLSVPLDQPAATIDAVLCRWGYMLLKDPEFALRETQADPQAGWPPRLRRLDRARREPLERRTGAHPAEPRDPREAGPERARPVHLGRPGPDRRDPRRRRVRGVRDRARWTSSCATTDVDDWWVAVTQTSTRIGDADKQMDFATSSDVLAELEEASKPFEQPDDRLVIPARTWIATATA